MVTLGGESAKTYMIYSRELWGCKIFLRGLTSPSPATHQDEQALLRHADWHHCQLFGGGQEGREKGEQGGRQRRVGLWADQPEKQGDAKIQHLGRTLNLVQDCMNLSYCFQWGSPIQATAMLPGVKG